MIGRGRCACQRLDRRVSRDAASDAGTVHGPCGTQPALGFRQLDSAARSGPDVRPGTADRGSRQVHPSSHALRRRYVRRPGSAPPATTHAVEARRKEARRKKPFHPRPRMWQFNRGGRRPSDRQSHAAVCRGSPPRPSARQRCSAREGRPRVALGPGSIAVSNESSPLRLPTHRRLRSPEGAGARILAPVPRGSWLAISTLLLEGMFRAQTGRRLVVVARTELLSRGEWMPGPSPRPAPHAAPLDIRLADAEARSSSDGVSAISSWRDRCAFTRLYCFWSC